MDDNCSVTVPIYVCDSLVSKSRQTLTQTCDGEDITMVYYITMLLTGENSFNKKCKTFDNIAVYWIIVRSLI